MSRQSKPPRDTPEVVTSPTPESGAGPVRTLILAAMRDELGALLEHLEAAGEVDAQRYGDCEIRIGTLAGNAVALAWTGEGAALAARGLEAILARLSVDRVLALGVAGGLSPALEPGDLVVGSRVWQASRPATEPDLAWADLALGLGNVLSGTLLTSKRMLCTAAEKAAAWTGMLGSTDNAAVDLESAVWAQIAADHGLPFLAVRAVCDTAREDLPFDLNECVDADGRVNRMKVARRAILQPSAMRELWNLKRRVKICDRRLADFAVRLLHAAPPPGESL